MAASRIRRDLQSITANPPPGVSVSMAGDNLFEWDAVIFGPGNTYFQNGIFNLKVTFPTNYPNSPPKIIFHSRMFHPNVYSNGSICLDLLQGTGKWTPQCDASTALVAVQALLGNPNPRSPANTEANQLYENNRVEYQRRVLAIVMASTREGAMAKTRNLNT